MDMPSVGLIGFIGIYRTQFAFPPPCLTSPADGIFNTTILLPFTKIQIDTEKSSLN